MRESYCVEVETFGEGNRTVLVHTINSDLESWIDEDYDARTEIIDDLFEPEFNYNIVKFSEENVYNEVLGDRMGFIGQLDDYKYTIIKICEIKLINLDELKGRVM
tara:strand:- start:376 stop:690 length:315 start_codon:yes stop_codon:yes gene_type:complete